MILFSPAVNLNDVCNGKSEDAQLDSLMANQEDPSHVDDNALYAVRVRTKKLRSFKVSFFLPLSLICVSVIDPESCFLARKNAHLY